MKLKPLGDRVLVRRSKEEERSPGGIIIPDAAKEKPAEGTVIAVGPGKSLDDGSTRPIPLESGDRILFGKWQGSEVKVEGEELVVVEEKDVLGVFEK